MAVLALNAWLWFWAYRAKLLIDKGFLSASGMAWLLIGIRTPLTRKETSMNNILQTLPCAAAPGDADRGQIELTWNWDPEDYGSARNFGHLAFSVDDIYATCQRLMDAGVTINRPPRDGHMAFVRSPDLISIELLQKGNSLDPREPWASMPNTGVW